MNSIRVVFHSLWSFLAPVHGPSAFGPRSSLALGRKVKEASLLLQTNKQERVIRPIIREMRVSNISIGDGAASPTPEELPIGGQQSPLRQSD